MGGFATHLTVVSLKSKLGTFWKDLAKWGVTSLGIGYYEFAFSTLEDVNRVRLVASWSLNPGMLKLFAWSKDFSHKTRWNLNILHSDSQGVSFSLSDNGKTFAISVVYASTSNITRK